MAFIDELRKARSSKVAVLHKFLTSYDPSSSRVYAFVEGEPDRIYYRIQFEKESVRSTDVYLFNCEGKQKVYDAFQDIVTRYPNCRRVLFFVDKDIDDIAGVSWPADPRIFVTDCYSVENYVVCPNACLGYLRDYVKMRKVEVQLEPLVAKFETEREKFHKLLMPVMAWIVANRRRGASVILRDVNMDELFCMREATVFRRPLRKAHSYLSKFRSAHVPGVTWKEVRAVCRELKRLESRSYVRGHFEAWWFIKFVTKACENLREIIAEGGGSMAISTQLNENNFIQILGSAVTPSPVLQSFLRFHIQDNAAFVRSGKTYNGFFPKIWRLLRGAVGR